MLKVNNLVKSYNQSGKNQIVINNISFSLTKGKILGFVGESGCGKTTIAKCITGLISYNKGNILLNRKKLDRMTSNEKNIWLRKHVQYIFQNPKGSFHSRKTIKKIFDETIHSIKKLTNKKISANYNHLMNIVGLNESLLYKKPNTFSGGEIQRIAIARALLVQPTLLIADEPVSSSDVINQAKILNLFKRLNKSGLTIIFITHDLAVAHYLCDWTIVMKNGEIVEQNSRDEIFENPQKNYTKKLIKLSKGVNRVENI